MVGVPGRRDPTPRELLADAPEAGDIRVDIGPDELASYCLQALTAAGGLTSKAAVRDLLVVSLSGLRTTP